MKYPFLLLLTIISFNVGCQTNTHTTMEKQSSTSNPYYSRTDTTPLKVSDEEWKKILPGNVYDIARKKGNIWEIDIPGIANSAKYQNYH
jgi:peptide-methionine (R)-S-oxide reductase